MHVPNVYIINYWQLIMFKMKHVVLYFAIPNRIIEETGLYLFILHCLYYNIVIINK